MPGGLISELEEAAAEAHNLAPFEAKMLFDRVIAIFEERTIEAQRDLMTIELISYLRTASSNASLLSESETVNALLDAAESLRVLRTNRSPD